MVDRGFGFSLDQRSSTLWPGIGGRVCDGAVCYILLLAASLVVIMAFAALEKPSPDRLHIQDEITRFTPTFGHGLGQLAGETIMLSLIACVGYRWFCMRLEVANVMRRLY